MGLRFQSFHAAHPDDVKNAFSAMSTWQADGLVVQEHAALSRQARQVADLAAENRLPLISPSKDFVCAGGLMSYDVLRRDLYRRAATYVDKILKGANPGDLPIGQPTRFEMVINLKTAEKLGLTIPPTMLAQADKVIRDKSDCRSEDGDDEGDDDDDANQSPWVLKLATACLSYREETPSFCFASPGNIPKLLLVWARNFTVPITSPKRGKAGGSP